MPLFSANVPYAETFQRGVLSLHERLGASTHYTGRGVVIAFIDSGYYMHPDLGDRILVHADASTNHIIEQHEVMTPDDLSWHGQMTSVVAAGSGWESGGRFKGLASNSRLVLIKITSPRGLVKESDILRGLRWLFDTHVHYGVKVVNLSVGGDFVSYDPEHPIYKAIRKLVDAGVTVIAAAGNRGHDSLVPPASSPHAITVGGYNDSNTTERAQWTAYHNDYGTCYDGSTKPDVTAPAVWIASPILPGSGVAREAYCLGPLLQSESERGLKRLLTRGYADLGLSLEEAQHPGEHLYAQLQARINTHKLIDGKHQHVDGTSVSAAIVTSLVAQMLEANPRLTPAAIHSILLRTAVPLPDVGRAQQGAGTIHAANAVLAAVKEQI
ncbi:MAG: S8 family serine peptidase [Chloroflexi bacterium]|nr:S8 family serine peptidase [Chloroflexota bacterium]